MFKSCSASGLLSLWQDQTPRCVVFQMSEGCCCVALVLRMRFKDCNANCKIRIAFIAFPLVKCEGHYLAVQQDQISAVSLVCSTLCYCCWQSL